MAHPGGRPPKFESVSEFDKSIQHYFDSITKTELSWDHVIVGYEDKAKKKPIIDKKPVLNNAGEQVSHTTYFEIPSITGLCQHIGITRETWKQYEHKEEFSDSIKSAKDRIEKYNIEQLYRRDQVTGIIFNLKNNFGWQDKQEIDSTVKSENTNINIDISSLPDEALQEIAKAQGEDAILAIVAKYRKQ